MGDGNGSISVREWASLIAGAGPLFVAAMYVPVMPALLAVAALLHLARHAGEAARTIHARWFKPALWWLVLGVFIQTWGAYRQLSEYNPGAVTVAPVLARAWRLPLICTDHICTLLDEREDAEGNEREYRP